MNIVHVDATERFLERLKGVIDPERKRKIIGEEFLQKYKRYRVRGLQWVFDPPQGDQL